MRRVLLAVAAVCLVLTAATAMPVPVGAASGPSCPSGQPCVVVQVLGDTGSDANPVVVTLADLANWTDVTDTQYFTRATSGGMATSEPFVAQGVSIRHLLQQLGVAPSSVTYTSIVGRTSYRSLLSAQTHDFDDPTSPDFPFQDGLLPVLWPIGSDDAIGYLRPLRSDTDVNGPDFLETYSEGELELTVHTSGTVLTPTITAQPRSVRAGSAVAFTAAVEDPDATETLSYTWSFGDGSGGQDAQTTHRYTTPGTYFAYVEVDGAHGSSGQSASVKITVLPGPSTSPPRPPTSTPAPGPSHGTGGAHNPTSGPVTGNGQHGGGAPQSSTPSESPARGSATASGSPATSAAHSSGPAPAPSPSGSRITGYLIAGFATTPGAASTAARNTPLTAPAARDGRLTRSVSGWLVAVLAALALLAFGAHAEARRPDRQG